MFKYPTLMPLQQVYCIKDKNKLKNFVWLVNNIIKYASKQNEDYLRVIEGIENNKLGQNVFISLASSDIARILQVNPKKVFLRLLQKLEIHKKIGTG